MMRSRRPSRTERPPGRASIGEQWHWPMRMLPDARVSSRHGPGDRNSSWRAALGGTMPATNAVIDLSHHNGSVDLLRARGAGIIGVIHKATQDVSYVDPLFASNQTRARDAGLLWGAYHLGTGTDGAAQAEQFLG